MWRQIFGGAASSRFHRPPSGLGLNEIVQAHLKSLRLWLAEYDIFTSQPDGDPGYVAGHKLLENREREEAYCNYREGEQYSVYFQDGGQVNLKVPRGRWQIRWLDILASEWQEATTMEADESVELSTPGNGHWLALITRVD